MIREKENSRYFQNINNIHNTLFQYMLIRETKNSSYFQNNYNIHNTHF